MSAWLAYGCVFGFFPLHFLNYTNTAIQPSKPYSGIIGAQFTTVLLNIAITTLRKPSNTHKNK